jgi:ribonuclease D
MAEILDNQNKTAWAQEEFEYLRCAESTPTRRDRWRRTTGIHKVRTASGLAAVRELWTTRDRIARSRDIAPGRILPDSAIIAAATADPKTIDDLIALPIFGGQKQRRTAKVWLDALAAARTTDQPPETSEPLNGPPPPVRWAKRKPEAAVRLEAARAALSELSRQVGVPAENLLSPDLVRRLCWDWQGGAGPDPETETATTAAADAFLRDAGARAWQRALVVPVLAPALNSPG